MNKILLLLTSLFFAACVNTSQEKAENKEEHQHNETSSELQLNNGAKWKADSITKVNVAAVSQIVNDTSYRNVNKIQFSKQVQVKLDTLVNQCKMTGPDHEALHAWLKQVLHDVKEIKEDEGKYEKNHAALKKDVESFYDYFE